MIITLTEQQLKVATMSGKQRQDYNLSLGKKRGPTDKLDGAVLHPDGCIGEMAVCVYTGAPWVAFSADYSKLKADVGGMYQARATRAPNGNLILHKYDLERHPGQAFILARIHDLPRVELVGWIYVEQGVRDEYWECGKRGKCFEERPCYLYPASKLRSMGTLPMAKKPIGATVSQ